MAPVWSQGLGARCFWRTSLDRICWRIICFSKRRWSWLSLLDHICELLGGAMRISGCNTIQQVYVTLDHTLGTSELHLGSNLHWIHFLFCMLSMERQCLRFCRHLTCWYTCGAWTCKTCFNRNLWHSQSWYMLSWNQKCQLITLPVALLLSNRSCSMCKHLFQY